MKKLVQIPKNQALVSNPSRPLKITTAIPVKNHPAARGLTQTNTATHISAVNKIFPASPMTAARRKAALSDPNFGVTYNAKNKAGKNAAKLPNMDEYAATCPTSNKPPASNRDTVD